MTFPIRPVDRRRAQQVEPLGSKRKFWFREGRQRLLFKAEDRGTGEDWAEVVACRLCQLLGLPHVDYELATEVDDQSPLRPGVVCHNMSPPPKSLILGNQLLLAFDPAYPHTQRFKVRQHTVEAVCEIVASIGPPEQEWMEGAPAGISSAMDVFVGYVLLDAWIANQDRHHENWGAIWTNAEFSPLALAPTFDHGAGLARNLQDGEREERLTTKDRNRSLPTFATRGRSAFYESPTAPKPLLLLDAFQRFAAHCPSAASIWMKRLRAVNTSAVSGILDEVPGERMSPISQRFTHQLLEINRQRLLDGERSE
jgi:hypothetical protein